MHIEVNFHINRNNAVVLILEQLKRDQFMLSQKYIWIRCSNQHKKPKGWWSCTNHIIQKHIFNGYRVNWSEEVSVVKQIKGT